MYTVIVRSRVVWTISTVASSDTCGCVQVSQYLTS